MPPQEGKSQRASRRFPLWGLTQNKNLRLAIAAYEDGVARRWGRTIRDDITADPDTHGLTVRPDLASQGEWQLDGHHGGVYSVGIGGALTGRAVDLLIIDDPVKDREQADSQTYRERVWNWWDSTAKTRLAPGAPVILILTRWHEDDLAGRLLAAEDGHRWKVVSIPAQCDAPENDPLGREVGEFMISARGRTQEQWDAIKAGSTQRTWSALYQQRPAPAEGAVWQSPWIEAFRKRTGDHPTGFARTVVSVDPAAKANATSDYTGIIVTAIDHSGQAWVLDDKALRGTPVEWGTAVWAAVFEWEATDVVVEDNQGGDMVVEVLRSAWTTLKNPARLAPPIRRVTATQSKRTRAEAVAALYETGKVHHAADNTGRLDKLETQMLAWTGDGKSPDRIDALVHGITWLFKNNTGESMQQKRHRWSHIRR